MPQQGQNALQALTTKAGDIPISRLGESSLVSASVPHEFHLHKAQFPSSELLRLHPTLEPFMQANDPQIDSFPVFSVVRGMTVIPVELPNLEALAAIELPAGGETIKTASAFNGGYLDAGWDTAGLINLYFYVRDVSDDEKTVLRTRMLLGNFEDPATGSSATGLAAYLALFSPQSQDKFVFDFDIVQGVEMGRRSDIGVHVVLSHDRKAIDEVQLIGGAVQVSSGQIRLDTTSRVTP
jgi:predicted PhzF superfamily epimerase YddE/YHI9